MLVIPSVRFLLPAEPLRDLVTSYYHIESPGPISDWVHPEWGNVRFTIRGRWMVEEFFTRPAPTPRDAALFGPTDRSRRFWCDEPGLFVGVGLTPLGWETLIGTDAGAAANRVFELGDRLGASAAEIVARLRAAADDRGRTVILDTLLLDRAARRGGRDPLTVRITEALANHPVREVPELAELAGVDQRRLALACRRAFGFTPKRLIRRQRFLRTLAAVRDRLDRPIQEIIDAHYYDQAHFNHDFQSYMGMSPRAYFNSPREVLRRAMAERDRVVGAPTQVLHRVP
ncbi:AraC family transcriptional regulator [Sphingomonas lenta]|uniref:HTH araC/xylS-type domain-containing protein n=1 Tax=Sphingomonas lenta TaxID=1141887 RepID=A0A2A2SBG7_9SPHN|nr:helix-turn-helix domain-containing protein [Sphingomonas lenta]PAX06598.1 hypothetical protein CKY28_15715 [Sphingomonas lenta]